MALILLHALLLASAAAEMRANTGSGSAASTNGNAASTAVELHPLPIYGGPPPSTPSSPSTPAAPAGMPQQPPCPPPAVTIVCCGGVGGGQAGQYTPQQPQPQQQPSNYAPPGSYMPYYNKSASPSPLLPAPVAAVACYVAVAYLLLRVLV